MNHLPMEDFFQFLSFAHTAEKVILAGMVAAAVGLVAYFIFD